MSWFDFKFINGNPDDLEGKILVSSSAIDNSSEKLKMIYPAVYSSCSPVDIINFQSRNHCVSDEIKRILIREMYKATGQNPANPSKNAPYNIQVPSLYDKIQGKIQNKIKRLEDKH